MTSFAFCSITVVAAFLTAAGQEAATLKEVARAQGGKIRVTSDVAMPTASLADVVAEAELIVQGRLSEADSRLSPNERAVLTYFTLVPSRVFKNVIASGLAERPGPTPPIVFAHPGGTVRVDGLEITYQSSSAAHPPLQLGEEVIAFLVRNDETGSFGLRYGGYGLLRVHNGRILAANKEVEQQRPLHMKLDEMQVTIERLVSSKK